MIIKEIDLQNIRSHWNSTVKFTDGINIITGNTGSGKSSMLMALEYALFGKIGEGREEGKMLLRRGASSGNISIKFEENGSEYIIKRGLKKIGNAVRNDDSDNIIMKDGHVVDLQNRASDLNDYILKTLKIESDSPIKTFESITYIKQDELKELIFDSGQSKQEYIDQLLQLNRYIDTYDMLKDVISSLKDDAEAKKLEEALAVDESDLIKIESRINELTKANEKAKSELTSINNELENNKVLLKQAESEFKFYSDKKNEHTKLSAEMNEKTERIEKLRSNISTLEKEIEKKSVEISKIDENRKVEIKKRVKYLEMSLEQKRQVEKDAYKELSEAKALERSILVKVSGLKSEIAALLNEKDDLKKQLKDAEERLEVAKTLTTAEEISGRIAQLNEYIKWLEKEKSSALGSMICPVCNNKITDVGHIEKEYDSRILDLKSRIKGLYAEVERGKSSKSRVDLDKEVGILNGKIDDISKRVSSKENELTAISVDDIRKLSEEKNKIYERLLSEENALSKDLSALNYELDAINKIEDDIKEIEMKKVRVDSLESEVNKLYEEVESTKGKLDELGFSQQEMDASENRHRELSSVIQRLESDSSRLKGNIESRESEISDNKSKLDEIKLKIKKRDALRKESEKRGKFLSMMENLRGDIRDIREYVRNRFIREFKSIFQARFSEIRSDSEYTIDIDNDYNVKVVVGNETLDAKALSGGEKTSVALAYRMALSSIASLLGGVNKNESLIMDEPTSGLDREDINALSTCITRINDIKQIVIVTHEDIMKNIADTLITVTKNSGESKVS